MSCFLKSNSSAWHSGATSDPRCIASSRHKMMIDNLPDKKKGEKMRWVLSVHRSLGPSVVTPIGRSHFVCFFGIHGQFLHHRACANTWLILSLRPPPPVYAIWKPSIRLWKRAKNEHHSCNHWTSDIPWRKESASVLAWFRHWWCLTSFLQLDTRPLDTFQSSLVKDCLHIKRDTCLTINYSWNEWWNFMTHPNYLPSR